jgi:hypothetical protein
MQDKIDILEKKYKDTVDRLTRDIEHCKLQLQDYSINNINMIVPTINTASVNSNPGESSYT